MLLFVDFHILQETSEEGEISTRLSSIHWQAHFRRRHRPARPLPVVALAAVVSSRLHLPSSCVLALGSLVRGAKVSIRMETRSFFTQIAPCSIARERERERGACHSTHTVMMSEKCTQVCRASLNRILSCDTHRQDEHVRAELPNICARTFQGFLQRFDEHIELIGLQGLGHILHRDCLTLSIRRILVCSVDERRVFSIRSMRASSYVVLMYRMNVSAARDIAARASLEIDAGSSS